MGPSEGDGRSSETQRRLLEGDEVKTHLNCPCGEAIQGKDEDELVSMWGASQSYTLGVNYYPNPNVHMMLNFGIVDNDEYATGRGAYQGDYDFQYVSMRFLTAF